MVERLRLFVGVGLPRARLEAVEAVVEPWRRAAPNARWVPLANQHVTLKFLGWTPGERMDAVDEVLGSVARGRGGRRRRPRSL